MSDMEPMLRAGVSFAFLPVNLAIIIFYEQVRDGFRQLILSGVLTADSKLPSVRELSAELAINPNTIQRAYRELEQEGYIVSVPGKGSFVRQDDVAARARRQELLERWDRLTAELRVLGVRDEELQERLKGDKP